MSGQTQSVKPTLEAVVTRFRREAGREDALAGGQGDGSSPELEVRLQDVDYTNFAAIYEALLAGRGAGGEAVPVGPGALTQMVSAIMDVRTSDRSRGEGPQRYLRPMRIREIFFEKGRRSRERFTFKEPLLIPYRVPSATGLTYTVALSAERPDGQGFSSDEGAVIRVKARTSFPLTLTGTSELKPTLAWRIDATVTRQIMGSDAGSSLKQIVAQMFQTAPPMTPANLLSALRLDSDPDAGNRQLYRYEVEAEFVGPPENRDAIRPADVTAAAEAILRLANPEYVREAAMQAEVYRTAQYIVKAPGHLHRFAHELGLKRLLPQALAVTRAEYRTLYPPKGLFLTDKADGRRALALVHDGRGVIVADTLLDGFVPAKEAARAQLAGDTILDGELVAPRGAEGGPVFYAFDVIAVAGEDLSQDGFEKRVGRLREGVDILRSAGLPAEAKAYTHLAGDTVPELWRDIRAVHEAERPYTVDGLIFVEPGRPYGTTNTYKWKSARDNTIDCLARRAPPNVLGKEPFVDRPGHKLYFLFVGINPDLFGALGLVWCPGYADLFGSSARGRRDAAAANSGSHFPIQFSPSDAPLAYVYHHPDSSPIGADVDGKVIEVRCAGGCLAAGGGGLPDWEAVRVREDRRREILSGSYFGNDFRTAEMIWLNYVDPFPVEQLWEGPALDYFMRPKAGIYQAQTAVVSFVKSERIASLKHASWVVDIGAGKGQDLKRYLDAEVQNLLAVDQDRAALSELVRRKYTFAKERAGPGGHRSSARGRDADTDARAAVDRSATTVHILVADVSEPYASTLEKFAARGLQRASADAVVCNLAVHYFLGSPDSLRNFVALARGAVKVGGIVAFTFFSGEEVHRLFKSARIPEGGTWDVFENGALKFSLKRLYSAETLEIAGQRIGVLHPFSAGQYYEEFLVNSGVLAAEFTARGFSVVTSASVAKSLPAFESHNRALASRLTTGDRQYLALYAELVVKREK
jgi:hypothetical protein